MIKIGISGICGKMGERIFSLAKQDKDFEVIFGLERKGHPKIGKSSEVKITDEPEEIKNCDCLIEFSSPTATVEHLPYLVKFKKHLVIGTTGLDNNQQDEVKMAAKFIPIVFSPNMSIGVNLLFKLIEITAKILKNYNVYIKEAHHIHKKDSPSGTAKKISQIINKQGYNIRLEDIEAVREGEIVGEHKVVFENNLEKIELFHSAKTRDVFAQGALLAAKWVIAKNFGLYSMEDVLKL